jgi:hypothetical protein
LSARQSLALSVAPIWGYFTMSPSLAYLEAIPRSWHFSDLCFYLPFFTDFYLKTALWYVKLIHQRDTEQDRLGTLRWRQVGPLVSLHGREVQQDDRRTVRYGEALPESGNLAMFFLCFTYVSPIFACYHEQ